MSDKARDEQGRYLPTHRGYTDRRPPEVVKQLTAWREGLIEDLGGNEEALSKQQLLLIDNVISIKGVILCIERYVTSHYVISQKGNLAPVLAQSYLAYCNSLERHLKDLGLERRVSDQTPSLVEVIKDISERKNYLSLRIWRPGTIGWSVSGQFLVYACIIQNGLFISN
jgi:hypothetical protein